MMHRHQPAATTHTVELDQVREINRRLAAPERTDVTAEMLGMAGSPAAGTRGRSTITLFGEGVPAVRALSPRAVLRSVTAEGSPEFPYVLGHFSDGAGDGPAIELHSQALQQLCLKVGLSQCWGTDAVLLGSSIR